MNPSHESIGIFPHLNLLALSIIVDMHVCVLLICASRISLIAEASVLMDLTIASPGFIAISANLPTWVKFGGALRNANALSRCVFDFTNATSLAVNFCAGVI